MAAESSKPIRHLIIDSLPDNLTSLENTRQFSLKELGRNQPFAERKKRAKLEYLKEKKSKLSSQRKEKTCITKSKK